MVFRQSWGGGCLPSRSAVEHMAHCLERVVSAIVLIVSLLNADPTPTQKDHMCRIGLSVHTDTN